MKYLFIVISLLITQGLQAQMFADFETPESSPELSAEGETAIISNPEINEVNATANTAFYEKISGNWHYVSMHFPDTQFVNQNNTITFLSHCSQQGRVYLKFWLGTNVLMEGWAHEYNNMPPANEWVKISKDISSLRNSGFTKLELAFGVDNNAAATVYFDEFELEKLVKPTPLFWAVAAANAFSENMVEGEQLGEYPIGTKAVVDSALFYADSVLQIQDDVSSGFSDSTAFAMNHVLTMVESKAIKHTHNLLDTLVSFETVNLAKNLSKIGESKHHLFGMHDATAYGINGDGISWSDDGSASKSDLKVVTGSHGAIASYDANEIVGKSFNDLAFYRNRLVQNYNEGGVNTICWHMDDPKYGAFYWDDIEASGAYNVVAAISEGGEYHDWYKNQLYVLASFFKGLRGSRGEAIPIIFRPYHEHTGAWFWWGKTHCSTQEYIDLWQFTIHYLRDTLGVHNVMYAFSPDASTMDDVNGYLSIFPGYDYMDVLGLDYYFGGSNSSSSHLTNMLTSIVELAKNENKFAALTETGNDGITPSTWYTHSLLAGIQGSDLSQQIAYVTTWRNASPSHHFVPYPGHASVPDFLHFYDDTTVLFLNDMLDVYDTLLTDEVRLPSTSARLNTFAFANDEGVAFDENDITVLMPEGEDLAELIALFEASQGSNVTINDQVQESGVTMNDFTEDVVYTIVSESGTNSSNYTITVLSSILTELVLFPQVKRLNIGKSVQFTLTAYNQYGIEVEVSPEWSVNGGGTIDEEGVFTAEELGNYEVKASVGHLSTTATVKVLDNGTTVNEFSEFSFEFYPMPARDYLYIKLVHTAVSKMKIDMITYSGQIVKQWVNADFDCNDGVVKLNVSDSKQGLYLIRIVDEENQKVFKIVID